MGCYVAKELSVGGLQQQAVVVAASKADEGCGGWAQDLDGTVFDGLVLARCVGEQLGRAAGVILGTSVNAHADQTREGWVADFFSVADLFGVETFVVVLGGQANGRMIGLERLQNDFARTLGSTRPAGNLCK